jgi:4-amino-4-deoxy-L-arabinose transferase-like glycosyltransferase
MGAILRSRWQPLAALAVASAGALVAWWVSWHVFEGLPHLEDEFAFLWQAHVMARGQIALPSPPEPKAFLVPFVVDYGGLRFAKYPPGWPAALSLAVRLGAPWLANALLGAFSLWLTYRLGERVRDGSLGLLAAALSLLSPTYWMLSGSLMSHIFSLFLALAFLHAWLDLQGLGRGTGKAPSPLVAAAGGGALGLLVITRPLTAVGIAFPVGLHAVWLAWRNGRRLRWGVALAGWTLAVAALLPLWQAALTGNPWMNLYTLWWPYDRVGFGPGIGVTATGHDISKALHNTLFSLRAGLHDLFGWPFLSWIFLPFGLWALRRARAFRLALLTFFSLVVAYGFYWVGSWTYGPRYYFEALPGLAVASAAGVQWLARGPGRRARRLAVTALLATLIVGNLLFYLPARLGMLSGLNDIRRVHMEPIQRAGLSRALIVVHLFESWREYGTLLPLTPPFTSNELIIVVNTGPQAIARLRAQFPGWPVYDYYPGPAGGLVPRSP